MRAAALLALLLAWTSTARSDAATDALLLARICVSEAGWECWETGDGYAIHEVLLRGAERHEMRYETFARSYSPRATGMAPSRLRPWVSGLRADGGEPGSWPRIVTRPGRDGMVRVEPHPPWASYRTRWLAVLSRAREVVSWRLDDVDEWSVCEGDVHDWGGSMDRDRATRLGLLDVDCGETSNDFYARPSQLDEPSLVEVENLDVDPE
jgi:hypothetical protein